MGAKDASSARVSCGREGSMIDLFRLAAGAESSSSKLTLEQVPLLRSKQGIITSLLDARRLAGGGMDESSSLFCCFHRGWHALATERLAPPAASSARCALARGWRHKLIRDEGESGLDQSGMPGRWCQHKMVPRGLEPRALWLLAIRSNQLSYETMYYRLKNITYFLAPGVPDELPSQRVWRAHRDDGRSRKRAAR